MTKTSFDELKNQWGWGGFTTQRCWLAARMLALFLHREAITSRPLFLSAIATRTRHARQTTIRVTSSHAKAKPASRALAAVAIFLRGLVQNAEQLTRWPRSWSSGTAKPARPIRTPGTVDAQNGHSQL